MSSSEERLGNKLFDILDLLGGRAGCLYPENLYDGEKLVLYFLHGVEIGFCMEACVEACSNLGYSADRAWCVCKFLVMSLKR